MQLLKQLHSYTRHLSLLYVEDDKELQSKMKEFLSDLFEHVDTADNGEEALEKYLKRSDDDGGYDLVITDINMPKMNGIELIKSIYAHNARQPVIVMSAHDETDYLLKLLQLGVNSFLLKPTQHDSLLRTLLNVTEAIINQKLVQQHYREIETLNSELALITEAVRRNNEELQEKNIALEKSLRIINGMHHKDSIEKTVPFTPHATDELEKDECTDDHGLSAIDKSIADISMSYTYKDIPNASLEALSKAIKEHADALLDDPKYTSLSKHLGILAETCSQAPGCTKLEELERIFSMLEGFFFIYKRWYNEWDNIDTDTFHKLCESIIGDIKVLVDVWQCRI